LGISVGPSGYSASNPWRAEIVIHELRPDIHVQSHGKNVGVDSRYHLETTDIARIDGGASSCGNIRGTHAENIAKEQTKRGVRGIVAPGSHRDRIREQRRANWHWGISAIVVAKGNVGCGQLEIHATGLVITRKALGCGDGAIGIGSVCSDILDDPGLIHLARGVVLN